MEIFDCVLGTGRHPWLFGQDHRSSTTTHTPLSPVIRLTKLGTSLTIAIHFSSRQLSLHL